MKKLKRKLQKTNKFARFIYFLISIVYIVSFIFFAKSIISLTGIETLIRYILLILLLFFYFLFLYIGLIKLLERKYVLFSFLSLLAIVLIVVFSFGSYFIELIFGKISGFKENDKVMYTSYLITLTDTKLNSNSVLGMTDDDKDIEGNILAKRIIKKKKLSQEVSYYDSTSSNVYLDMLYDLFAGKVDGIFISENYVTLYGSEEDFPNLGNTTKVLYKESKEYKNNDVSLKSDKSLTSPFTVLIMGVDSESNGLNANASFNGDTLILATFNPNTYSATLLSIPRDTYVPIACRKNNYAKINSSAAYGTSCVIDTIEQFTDISIDYYAKINFKGVVDLVEAVNGITVNVEEPDFQINHGNDCKQYVCEQDSNRNWGKSTIYLTPGEQRLNGEEALAYSRNRGQYLESDLARNRHQQDVIMAIANEILKMDSFTKFKKVLNAISDNFITNLSTEQILSSYKIFKGMLSNAIKDEDFITIQKSKLETYSLPVYLPASGRTTSALGYYEDSLKDIQKALKINLELEEPELIKTFSYSLNEEYEQYVSGKNLRSGSSNSLLRSFVGKTRSEAEEYCDNNNLDCSFTYVDSSSDYYNADMELDLITNQNPHQGTLMKDVDSVTFYINGAD